MSRIEGGEVANNENLKGHGFHERTASEQREIAIMGGKASGKARREKANFNKTLNKMLTTEIDNEEWKQVLESLGLECTLESAMLMAQIKEAAKGNTKAAYFVAQYAGQESKSDSDLAEQQAKIDLMNAQKEKTMPTVPEDEEITMKDPHDVVIPEFWDILDDEDHEHAILTSGRAGTKSSFAGILGI